MTDIDSCINGPSASLSNPCTTNLIIDDEYGLPEYPRANLLEMTSNGNEEIYNLEDVIVYITDDCLRVENLKTFNIYAIKREDMRVPNGFQNIDSVLRFIKDRLCDLVAGDKSDDNVDQLSQKKDVKKFELKFIKEQYCYIITYITEYLDIYVEQPLTYLDQSSENKSIRKEKYNTERNFQKVRTSICSLEKQIKNHDKLKIDLLKLTKDIESITKSLDKFPELEAEIVHLTEGSRSIIDVQNKEVDTLNGIKNSWIMQNADAIKKVVEAAQKQEQKPEEKPKQ